MEAKSHPLIERLIDLTETSGGEAVETSRDVLHKLSGKDNPQTVLGVYDELTQTLDSIDRSPADLWFVAQSLRDPGTLGRTWRTADADVAGGLSIVESGCYNFSVEAVRPTGGALITQQHEPA